MIVVANTRGRVLEQIELFAAEVHAGVPRRRRLMADARAASSPSWGSSCPAPFPPAAAYVAGRQQGDLLFVSGHGPMRDGKVVYTGKLGAGSDIGRGAAGGRTDRCSTSSPRMKAELGELSRVTGFVKLLGVRQCHTGLRLAHPGRRRSEQAATATLRDRAPLTRAMRSGMARCHSNITTEIEAIAVLRDLHAPLPHQSITPAPGAP